MGWAAADRAGALPAFGRSIVLGLLVAALAVPVGMSAARALTLGQVRWSRLISVVLLAPVAVPPFAVVMGFGVLLLRMRVSGLVGVVLVLAVAALPYTTYTMRVAYGAYDIGFEEEARTLGASASVVFRRIELPHLAPAIAGAAFLAFLVAWSDYIVTIIIGGGQIVTYPILLAAAAAGTGNEAEVAAMSTASLAPPLALLVVVALLGRKWRNLAQPQNAGPVDAGQHTNRNEHERA